MDDSSPITWQITYLFDFTEASRGFLKIFCITLKVLQYSFSVVSISCAITERRSPSDNLSVRLEFYKKPKILYVKMLVILVCSRLILFCSYDTETVRRCETRSERA